MSATDDSTLQCPLRSQWLSFRLVDEWGAGTPYAGLAYELSDSQGQTHSGTLDGEGFARLDNISAGALLLSLPATYSGNEAWYVRLMSRDGFPLPLSALQVAAEQSPSGPKTQGDATFKAEQRAQSEQATFYRVEVRDFVAITSHLPEQAKGLQPRPPAHLASCVQKNAPDSLGVALAGGQHHVLEVKALRAYRPLFSLSNEFNALDAYQLALISTLVYAPFNLNPKEDLKGQAAPPYAVAGTLGHVLQTSLAQLAEPKQFGDATPYHLLTEEVAYSKRLEVVPHDPRYAGLGEQRNTPQAVHYLHDEMDLFDGRLAETQAFITHDDRMVLIAARGTQEIADWVRDANAAQVPNEAGEGQAHEGFHEAFKAVRDFVAPYLEAFHTNNQKLVVCGHSLGGAIALLLAEWLRRLPTKPEVLLYTYGSPRAGDEAFVEGARALQHHRIVNHNDLIPTVPAPWMDTKGAFLWPSVAALIGGSTGVGALLFLAGVYNFSGDDYQHHGQQWHFMPLPQADGPPTSVLWKPGCAGIEQATCARYNYMALKGDMPDRSSLSAMDHTMLDGYVPACHATLLRWQESLKRGGSTLTNLEQKWLSEEIELYGKKLRRWKNVTWSQYKNDPRHRSIPTWDLRRNYQEAQAAIEEDVTVEIDKLGMTLQRLALLAKQPITPSAVYGQAQNHLEFEKSVARWLAHNENRKTPQLARIPGPSTRQYA